MLKNGVCTSLTPPNCFSKPKKNERFVEFSEEESLTNGDLLAFKIIGVVEESVALVRFTSVESSHFNVSFAIKVSLKETVITGFQPHSTQMPIMGVPILQGFTRLQGSEGTHVSMVTVREMVSVLDPVPIIEKPVLTPQEREVRVLATRIARSTVGNCNYIFHVVPAVATLCIDPDAGEGVVNNIVVV